jgi:DNA polymerase-1
MKIFLLDTMSFVYRAYHAAARQPFTMCTKKGFPTGATFIFCKMLRRLMHEFKPEYMVALCDAPGETIRDREYALYKANRKGETPLELVKQFPKIFEAIDALGIPKMELAGYEADDLIGTLAKAAHASDLGCQIYIVSGDKDMFQLVNDRTFTLNPMKDLLCDAAKVEEVVGVPPGLVTDVMALLGDAVDNVPGAPGIGKKGSVDLVKQFGSLERALERAGEVKRKSYRESLQNNREGILLSKRLVTIRCDAPVDLNIESMRMRPTNQGALTALYSELEFASLLKQEAAGGTGMEIEFDQPDAEFKAPEPMPETQADDLIDTLFSLPNP